jgi:hypothetical protein
MMLLSCKGRSLRDCIQGEWLAYIICAFKLAHKHTLPEDT